MDTSVLQQKLAQQRHLLPSQQELLNRLLFQLTFNNFQNIGLVGAEGSGKSTLALAIAELFSEQANVALLTAPVDEQAVEQQLLQQWFGQRQAQPALAEHFAAPLATAASLLLIVDNFSQLSNSARQKLLLLDCLGIFMLDKPSADMALNLSINVPTLQDAGQVLKDKPLDPLAIAERFAASAGNMHLLHSAVVKAEERKSQSAAFWLIPTAIVLLLVAGLVSWYLPTTDDVLQQPLAIATSSGQQLAGVVETPPQPAVEVLPAQPEPDSNAADIAVADDLVLSEFATIPEDVESVTIVEDGELHTDQAPEVLVADDQTVSTTSESVEQTEITMLADADKVIDSSQAEIAIYQELQLLALPAEFRVLQLAVLSSAAAVDRFKQTYPDTEIIVYQRSWQGQLQWVILAQQAYPETASAREGRALLAEPLRAAGPFIKPVAAVQQEIKALTRLRNETVVQE